MIAVMAVVGLAACSARSSPADLHPTVRPGEVVTVPECRSGFTGVDGDADGVPDACELAVARAFAPELVLSSADCSLVADRLDGGLAWGVLPQREGLRVVYLPAYRRDCGWTGPKCLLRLAGGCRGHAGDSELIAVDLVLTADAALALNGVFLSAHCFGRSDAACRWYRNGELASFARAAQSHGPVVWVARDKHANYTSAAACDRGHLRFDTCDGAVVRLAYPVDPTANVGSETHPFPSRPRRPPPAEPSGTTPPGADCITLPALNPLAPERSADRRLDRPVFECFWSDRPFRGWIPEGASDLESGFSTAYVRYLRLLSTPSAPGIPPT